MARLPRAVLPGYLHLVVHRGHNGGPVFTDTQDAQVYLDSLRESLKVCEVALHAYALRAREVWLLLTPAAETSLSRLMQTVGRRYVRVFNLRHGRTGSPWEGRFRSTVVEPETHLLACMRVIDADLAREPDEVTPATNEGTFFSSAEIHLGQRSEPWLAEHPVFWTLGNTPFDREANYRRFLDQLPAPAERAAIEAAALKGWALGSASFADRVAEVSGRRAAPVPRGRPKKKIATDESDPNS